ncbi:MAG TPA: hypothetical protein ENK54_08515 [Thiotrichales bacterium]|nr:hypothetical protein [Thiotrichales bacterium]
MRIDWGRLGGWLLVVALVAWFLALREGRVEQWLKADRVVEVRALVSVPDCDVSASPCVARGEGIAVRVAIGPGVTPMSRFPIRVEVDEGGPWDRVVAEFTMPQMNMGENRFLLEKGEVGWQGEGVLPFCVSGRSEWILTLDLEQGDSVWRGRFPFRADRPAL